MEKKPDILFTKKRNTFLTLYDSLPVSPSLAIYIKPDGSHPRRKIFSEIETLDSHCILYTSGFSLDIVRL